MMTLLCLIGKMLFFVLLSGLAWDRLFEFQVNKGGPEDEEPQNNIPRSDVRCMH